jgi:AcrR family transcriptional regulator
MGRPPGATAAHTRARVLAAAVPAFATDGLARTRLEDVARAAGITRPSLLHHFGTKEALYAEVVRGAFAQLGDALVTSLEGGGKFPRQLDRITKAYLGFLAREPDVARLLLRELLEVGGVGHEILKERVVPLLEWVEGWITENGGQELDHSVPLRAAIMQVVSDGLLNAAAAELRKPFWGDTNHGLALARRLLLRR